MTKRRGLLVRATAVTAAVTGLAFGSGAFTRTEAARDYSLSIVPDEDAQLSVEVTGAGTKSTAINDDTGVLEIDLEGVNPTATTTIGRVESVDFDEPSEIEEEAFTVTNDSGHTQDVSFEIPELDDESNARVGVVVTAEDLPSEQFETIKNGDGEVTQEGIDDGHSAVGVFIVDSDGSESIDATLRISAARSD